MRWRAGIGLVRDADRRGVISGMPSNPPSATAQSNSGLTRLKRYNPELQRKSLENRKGKQEDFDKFVNNLKSYSKSDKPGMLSLTNLTHAEFLVLTACSLGRVGASSGEEKTRRRASGARQKKSCRCRGRREKAGDEELASLRIRCTIICFTPD